MYTLIEFIHYIRSLNPPELSCDFPVPVQFYLQAEDAFATAPVPKHEQIQQAAIDLGSQFAAHYANGTFEVLVN